MACWAFLELSRSRAALAALSKDSGSKPVRDDLLLLLEEEGAFSGMILALLFTVFLCFVKWEMMAASLYVECTRTQYTQYTTQEQPSHHDDNIQLIHSNNHTSTIQIETNFF